MRRICTDCLHHKDVSFKTIFPQNPRNGFNSGHYSNEPRQHLPNEPRGHPPWTLIEAARAATTAHIRRTYYMNIRTPEYLLCM